jgi:hypothetical protein
VEDFPRNFSSMKVTTNKRYLTATTIPNNPIKRKALRNQPIVNVILVHDVILLGTIAKRQLFEAWLL